MTGKRKKREHGNGERDQNIAEEKSRILPRQGLFDEAADGNLVFLYTRSRNSRVEHEMSSGRDVNVIRNLQPERCLASSLTPRSPRFLRSCLLRVGRGENQ